MYMCVRGIDYASFYDFSIRFWHCSNRVELLVFHFITLAGILCNHISKYTVNFAVCVPQIIHVGFIPV